MDVKKLYGVWLEERRKNGRPPLPTDAAIYLPAFIEWVEARPAFETCTRELHDKLYDEGSFYCRFCGERLSYVTKNNPPSLAELAAIIEKGKTR